MKMQRLWKTVSLLAAVMFMLVGTNRAISQERHEPLPTISKDKKDKDDGRAINQILWANVRSVRSRLFWQRED